MSTDTREERLARRIADLYANDRQFADAGPSEAITAATDQPGLRLPQGVRTVMEGYADRPALGQRAVQFVNDPQDGRTSVELLPAPSHRWSGAAHEVAAAVRAMFSRPEKPRAQRHYPQRFGYLENALISREMDRL